MIWKVKYILRYTYVYTYVHAYLKCIMSISWLNSVNLWRELGGNYTEHIPLYVQEKKVRRKDCERYQQIHYTDVDDVRDREKRDLKKGRRMKDEGFDKQKASFVHKTFLILKVKVTGFECRDWDQEKK